MVEDGLTVVVAAVPPVFQEYVVAPVAFKVAIDPAQIVAELATTVGVARTDTDVVEVELHPLAVTVTE